MIRTESTPDERLHQGDVIRDVEYVEVVAEQGGTIEVRKLVFPLVIVLTQECDLAQDFRLRDESRKNEDKWLISVLVAPLYNAEHVFTGEHLSELNIRMQPIKKTETRGKNLLKNETPRYHYLEFPKSEPLVPCVIDFKHYFSVAVPVLLEVKRRGFVCRVAPLFRESISHRFASFLSRIGLPDLGD